MDTEWFEYKTQVTETMLDVMGHLNHARYLTVFEEARWQLCYDAGYSLERMQKEGIGFVILDAYIQYLKEVKSRDQLLVRTRFTSLGGKIWTIEQEMNRPEGESFSTIKLKAGLFDLNLRKLVLPDETWLKVFNTR